MVIIPLSTGIYDVEANPSIDSRTSFFGTILTGDDCLPILCGQRGPLSEYLVRKKVGTRTIEIPSSTMGLLSWAYASLKTYNVLVG